jgi:hypothetical protein
MATLLGSRDFGGVGIVCLCSADVFVAVVAALKVRAYLQVDLLHFTVLFGSLFLSCVITTIDGTKKSHSITVFHLLHISIADPAAQHCTNIVQYSS